MAIGGTSKRSFLRRFFIVNDRSSDDWIKSNAVSNCSISVPQYLSLDERASLPGFPLNRLHQYAGFGNQCEWSEKRSITGYWRILFGLFLRKSNDMRWEACVGLGGTFPETVISKKLRLLTKLLMSQSHDKPGLQSNEIPLLCRWSSVIGSGSGSAKYLVHSQHMYFPRSIPFDLM